MKENSRLAMDGHGVKPTTPKPVIQPSFAKPKTGAGQRPTSPKPPAPPSSPKQ